MKIDHRPPSLLNPNSVSGKAPFDQSKFENMVKNDFSMRSVSQTANSLEPKALNELAQRFTEGKITGFEATRDFVSMVVKQRFPALSSHKMLNKMEDDLATVFSNDPQFSKQFKEEMRRVAIKS